MLGNLYFWVAEWNLSRAEAALLLGGHDKVADFVDCTHSAVDRVRQTSIQRFGAYITGSSDIRWTSEDFNKVMQLGYDRVIVRIDQSNSNLPLISQVKHYLVKDEETGASTIGEAVTVAKERIHAGDDYVVYCDRSDLGRVESACAKAGLPHGKIIGYQWASPSSNPNTPLPGTNFTLNEANADLSVVLKSWLPLPSEQVPTHHPRMPLTGDQWDTALIEFDPDDGSWKITPRPIVKKA